MGCLIDELEFEYEGWVTNVPTLTRETLLIHLELHHSRCGREKQIQEAAIAYKDAIPKTTKHKDFDFVTIHDHKITKNIG